MCKIEIIAIRGSASPMDQKCSDEPDAKRVFFAAQVNAPWAPDPPLGKIISETTRHVTLAFIGQESFSRLQKDLVTIPPPIFKIGPSGIADRILFLPPEQSRVVALNVIWSDPEAKMNIYQKTLSEWLNSKGYSIDKRPFFPHISIARSPFDKQAWIDHIQPLPFFVKSIQLYQSLGNLNYLSLWEIPLLPPFEEQEHTADIAFLIRGNTPQELHSNAQTALAFKFPDLTHFFVSNFQASLEEIIISLNQVIARADAEWGCPFKAVSFHGNINSDEQKNLFWEMIVDV